MADHLAPYLTDGGFTHLPAIADSRRGRVRVYESRVAEAPHLWLSADEPDQSGAHIHLTAEAAWQLKEQIEWLLEHHYQGDARPAQELQDGGSEAPCVPGSPSDAEAASTAPLVLHTHWHGHSEFSHVHPYPRGDIAHAGQRFGRIIGEVEDQGDATAEGHDG